MKIAYITKTSFFDTAIYKIESLSLLNEVYLIMEVSPELWKKSLFDVPRLALADGLHDAENHIEKYFTEEIKNKWSNTKEFKLLIYNNPHSLSPKNWKTTNTLIKYLKKIKPDIIHFDDTSLRTAPFIFRLRKENIVVNIHDPSPHIGENNFRVELSRKLTFKYAKHFILHSNYSKTQFNNRYGYNTDRVSVINFGVINLSSGKENKLENKEKSVLLIGRLSPYKGIDIFIEAAKSVANTISNCNFIIAGKPIDGYRLPDIPELPNGCRIKILNKYIGNDEFADLICSSRLLVCPYLDATQSGIVLNAYAFNKPVIVSNVGGMPEYVINNKTGIIIAPNANELSIALQNLLSSERIISEMESNITNYVNTELNWGKYSELSLSIYNKVIASK